MCGIAGIIAPQALRYKSHIDQMISSLSHRGPDEDGVHSFSNCVLGHTRLTIIDLSTGKQPMLSNDESIGVTFNGEIYGYKTIKNHLKNYDFRTSSDTEVILALYESTGERFIHALPGMFSFGIWDENEQSLFCARDRFGEKPFYYAWGRNNEFIFASEIKALLKTGLITPVLDYNSLIHYLHYLYIPPDKTIYSNIFSLPPAHCLTFKNGNTTVKKYWDLPVIRDEITTLGAVEEFKYLLDTAIKNQLIADVPVGAFLSGGLDSTTVVALASKHTSKISTFSFGFSGDTNELKYAAEVARFYGTNHHTLIDEKVNIADLLIKMQNIYDEPFGDSSNIPTYLLSQQSSKFIKVVLSGDGGDELFAGYDWYHHLLNMQNERKLCFITFLTLWMMNKLLQRFSIQLPAIWFRKLEATSYQRRYTSIIQAHTAQKKIFHSNEIASMACFSFHDMDFTSEQGTHSGTIEDAFRQDLTTYLPGDILTKVDRASMSNGLEIRSPFLDMDFASFCISLPYRIKISSSSDKLILRQAFSHLWPHTIQTRTKQGFGAPVQLWLEKSEMTDLKQEYLFDKSKTVFSLLDYNSCLRSINNNPYKTWTLLNLSLWLEKHNCDFS